MYTMQFKNVIQSIESHIRKTGNGYDNSLHNKWFSYSLYLAHTHNWYIMPMQSCQPDIYAFARYLLLNLKVPIPRRFFFY